MRHRALRIAVLIAAIFATLGVATVSAMPEHLHANAPASSCDLCFVAHAVTCDTHPAVPSAPAPLVRERQLDCRDVPAYQSQFRSFSHTRGPPSLAS